MFRVYWSPLGRMMGPARPCSDRLLQGTVRGVQSLPDGLPCVQRDEGCVSVIQAAWIGAA